MDGESARPFNVQCAELMPARLDAVTFVMDYLQFQFRDATLNLLRDPIVHAENVTVGKGDVRWAEWLRRRVGTMMERLIVDDNNMLRMRFADGAEIVTQVEAPDHPYPETVNLIGGPKGNLAFFF